MTELKQLLFSLSRACCVNERQQAAKLVLKELETMQVPAETDSVGNIIATLHPARAGHPHLMLEAHLDEIAFIVTAVTEEGFLRVAKVGGPDLRVLAGHEVTVFGTEPLFGVFCCQPPHLTAAEDRKKVPPIDEAAVDIGFNAEEAHRRVSPGDYVFLRREPVELANGLVSGKAMDNRAGVATVLLALQMLQQKELSCGVTAVFALGEELGERGAITSSFAVAPDSAIVVDTSHALTQESPPEKCGKFFAGPMVGVAPSLDASFTEALVRTAKQNNIRFQREIMSGRTGTDADVVATSRGGVKTALLSIPLRYMHTANEIVALQDITDTATLIAAYLSQSACIQEGKADA